MNSVMRRYRDTLVSKGSALWNALESKDEDAPKIAKKIYDETTNEFIKLYGKEDATWFRELALPKHKEKWI